MTLQNACGNTEALIGFLYDEIAPAERAVFTAHLATCAKCAEELAALRGARFELAQWTPPDAQLGFRIVSDPVAASGVSRKEGNVLRPARWWQQPLPAWAQAAAAVLIFSAGLGLGTLRGVTPSAANGATNAAPGAAVTPVSARDLAALEQRLRQEMQAGMQARPAAVTARAAETPAAPAAGNGASLQQVRALIAESEQRQQRELTLRTAEVIRDFDTQRRGDLTRIQQTLGRIEGSTGAEMEQLRQQQNYLLRVSQRPQ